MDIYLLFHGRECGDREDCSIFYTPCEPYTDRDLFLARRIQIRKQQKQDPEAYTWVQLVKANEPQIDLDEDNDEDLYPPSPDPALWNDEEFDDPFGI